ncbi:MAG: phage tail sheath subtilisin-like domain-containing protein [Spirochaetales bacterium]|nr:phage tail sheath subtilisin-like domain-containing protein [Spirochaetales bacterium]
MGVSPATFSSAGQISQHYIPGAYSRNNFLTNEGGGASTGNICILGYADAGEPQTLLVFDSYNDAKAELESGNLLDGIKWAFNPGNDYTPQQVGCMRVNPGTQASLTLQSSSTDIFGITSFSYGTPMNQLRILFTTGTTTGSYKIVTDYKGEGTTTDDIIRESMSVQYVGGDGTAATITIGEDTLTTTVTDDTDSNLSITLSEFSTISELVNFIDNQANYTATLLTTDSTENATDLDYVTTGDIFSDSLTLTSNYQAVYEALVADSYLGDITKSGTDRTVPDTSTDYVYFTGATAGSYTTSEFTDALEALEDEDIQLVSTTSEEAAVHLLIRNHCVDMNSVEGRRERQFYVGGAESEDVDAVTSRASTLNSKYGSLCSPGFYNYDDNGDYTLYSSAYYACMQVGMVSALNLNTPTTAKTMNVLSWEKNYTRSQKNTLIKGGVLCGGKNDQGSYTTIRSITTYQSASLQQNEASIMRETLYQAADLRNRLESGLIGAPNTGNSTLATVDSIFERAIKDWYGLGIIVAGDDSSLYQNKVVSIDGDVISIQYDTYNTAPVNFVFITHNVAVYSST